MNNSIANINPQPNIQKKTHNVFVFMLSVFMLLIFARGVAGISFPAVILLGWFSFTALASDRDELLSLCMICIPASAAFQYKYGLFVCIVVYILKFKDDIKLNMCILPVIIMMIWELIHGLFYDFSMKYFLHDFPELILLSFIMCVKKRDMDYSFICRVLGYVTCIIGVFVLFNVLKSNGYSLNTLFESGNYRFGVGNEDATQFGLNYNPNGMGSLCNCAIIALMLVCYMKKQVVFDYVVLIGLVLIGGLTVSRSFILTCVTLFVVFAFLGNDSGKGRIKTIFITGVLFLVIWFVVANFLPSVYDSFIERFSVDDITNGRGELMDFYDEHIYSSWKYALFGIGLQNMAGKMNQIYGLVTAVCHSGFQEIIVVWGYPGLAMFLAMILCMVHSARGNVKKYSIVNFFPLIFVIITSLAGQFISSGWKLLMLSYAYITLLNDFKKEREKS